MDKKHKIKINFKMITDLKKFFYLQITKHFTTKFYPRLFSIYPKIYNVALRFKIFFLCSFENPPPKKTKKKHYY